jgi:hypothetical protein
METITPDQDIWAQLAYMWDAANLANPGDHVDTLLLNALDTNLLAVVQTGAVEALSLRLARGSALQRAMLVRLRHPRDSVRWRVAWMLGRMQPPAPAVVTALVGCTHDPSPAVRARAASALGLLGVGSPAVIGALLSMLSDPFPFKFGENDEETAGEGGLGPSQPMTTAVGGGGVRAS